MEQTPFRKLMEKEKKRIKEYKIGRTALEPAEKCLENQVGVRGR